MQRTVLDWGGNMAAFVFLILLNVLSKALPINGQTMPEISAKYPSLFTPAGFTFSIWGVIYLGLLAFVVWQALPAQRGNSKIAGVSWYFRINCVLNGLWIIAWHYDLLLTSVVLMSLVLATLIMIYRRLIPEVATASPAEHLVLYMPFSLYLGWITVLAIANLSALQTASGWDDLGMTAVQWTLVKLAVAGAVGAAVVLKYRDPVFPAVILWATYGISVMQSANLPVAGAAMTLSLLFAILVAMEFASRIRRNKFE